MTADNGAEISIRVADEIASWRRVFANRKSGVDARDLLRKAAADLWETLEINKSVYPDSQCVARQEVVDALQDMAESSGIGPDDAQRIFHESFKAHASNGADKEAHRQEQRANRHSSAAEKVNLTFFDDCDKVSSKPWIFKNVMARAESSSWYGAPGGGKSSLLTDIAVNAAAARDWRGYLSKDRCGVVYFALERGDLVKRRLAAYKRRDNLTGLPIAVAGQIIDLLNKNCVEVILRAIADAEQKFGVGVGLAIIDSYSKGIAAGGGDEDRAKDQNLVAANLRRVIDRIGIHIAGIGHPGKDETRGERGSNARLADVDLQVHVTGNASIKTATITKANDQPLGILSREARTSNPPVGNRGPTPHRCCARTVGMETAAAKLGR
jgi:RecA-family ATPase